MTNINSKKFNFNFFLSNNKEVKNLELGAIENGGATKINNKVYSNIQGNDLIILNEKSNTLAIYIPSTVDTDAQTDNTKYINYSMNYIQNLYNSNKVQFEATQGSWYSEDMKKVVYDNITIVSVTLDTVQENDINNFVILAQYIKTEMNQEGVSIAINKSLAIV